MKRTSNPTVRRPLTLPTRTQNNNASIYGKEDLFEALTTEFSLSYDEICPDTTGQSDKSAHHALHPALGHAHHAPRDTCRIPPPHPPSPLPIPLILLSPSAPTFLN